MAVFRVNKNNNYTVMSNYHFKDKRLSLKAKGLLSLMLSLPNDWDYTIAGLVSICKENETSIKNALNELKNNCYLEINKKQNEKGQFEYIYNIYEEPYNEKPEVENLGVEKPEVENQGQLNTNILNTDKLNTKKINAEIIKCYEENIGLITPATAELLLDYLKDMDKELIIKAIKIASINNKRTGRYVQGILNDWSKKGIKTLLDVEKEQKEYEEKNIQKKEKQIFKNKKESNFEQREYTDLSYLYANGGTNGK